MPTLKITKRAVDAAAPGERDQFLWDTEVPGFGMKITPKGSRSYVVQYRMGGRETNAQRWTIGKHGVWTPDTARDEARRLLRMVDQGIDPKDAERKRRREAVDLAFDRYADLFLEQYLKPNWKGWSDGQRHLDLHIKPLLGRRPLTSLTRSDLTPIFDRINDRPALKRSVFATLRKMFNWAVGRGDLLISPMNGMDTPEGAASRDRTLSGAELAAVWQASFAIGPIYGPITRLLLLNGQRLEENTGMEWRELDLASATWTIPESRTKNKRVQIVPLGPLSMEILRGQPRLHPTYVFSSGRGAPNGWSKARVRLQSETAKVLAKQAAERGDVTPPQADRWTPHDLRRTVATDMAGLGVPAEIIEATLNHISGAKAGVAGVYNRYKYLPEKTAALLKWDEHVRALVAAPNVSPKDDAEAA